MNNSCIVIRLYLNQFVAQLRKVKSFSSSSSAPLSPLQGLCDCLQWRDRAATLPGKLVQNSLFSQIDTVNVPTLKDDDTVDLPQFQSPAVNVAVFTSW